MSEQQELDRRPDDADRQRPRQETPNGSEGTKLLFDTGFHGCPPPVGKLSRAVLKRDENRYLRSSLRIDLADRGV
jgi:hypothetical protein